MTFIPSKNEIILPSFDFSNDLKMKFDINGDFDINQDFDVLFSTSTRMINIPYLKQNDQLFLTSGQKMIYSNSPYKQNEYIIFKGLLYFNGERNFINDEAFFKTHYEKIMSYKRINDIKKYKIDNIKNPFTIDVLNVIKQKRIYELQGKNIEKKKKELTTLHEDYTPEKSEERQMNLINDYEYNKEMRTIGQQIRKQKDEIDKEYNPELFKQHQQQLKPLKPKEHQKVSFVFDSNGYPYRSLNKLKSLYDDFDNEKFKQVKHYNNFDIKESKKEYSLRTCSKVKYTFIGDIFFESNKSAFLLLINVNTRFAYAYQLGDIEVKEIINVDDNNKEYEVILAKQGKKTTDELIKAFNKHLKVSPVNILRFDGEKAIASKEFKDYLNKHNIKFIPAITVAHTSLSLIDRLCRTIRDIAFNLNASSSSNARNIDGIFTQIQMNKILNYYNNSRHETLTNIIFKSHPEMKRQFSFISPSIMNDNEELEKIFVEECLKYNYDIVSNSDYKLNKNDVVRITSEKNKLGKKRTILDKDDYKVIGQEGNIYKLKNVRTNKTTFKPRFEIAK